jgi:hypothetical protein
VWNVALEVEGNLNAHPVERIMVERLLREFGFGHVAVSYSPRRYSVRFRVDGDNVVEATANAVREWEKAISHCGLPAWPLVRLEAVPDSDLRRLPTGETYKPDAAEHVEAAAV